MFPPAVLVWEAFQEVTLIAPWVASEASKILMDLDTNLGYHAVYPGASPPRLGGRARRDEYGT